MQQENMETTTNSAIRRRAPKRLSRPGPSHYRPAQKTCRILFDNLKYGVKESELKKVFGRIGSVKKAAIFYGSSGASTGSGEVIYFCPFDATRAMKEFNGKIIFGRRINMKFVEDRQPLEPNRQGGRRRPLKMRLDERQNQRHVNLKKKPQYDRSKYVWIKKPECKEEQAPKDANAQKVVLNMDLDEQMIAKLNLDD